MLISKPTDAKRGRATYRGDSDHRAHLADTTTLHFAELLDELHSRLAAL